MSLTSQQDHFAQGVASGKSQSEAYRAAYPKSQKWKPSAVWAQSSRLMADSRVAARVDAIRAELAEKGLWTREQSVLALVGVVNSPEKLSDVIAAVKELNSMHGFNAAQKVELKYETMSDEELAAHLLAVESKLVSR